MRLAYFVDTLINKTVLYVGDDNVVVVNDSKGCVDVFVVVLKIVRGTKFSCTEYKATKREEGKERPRSLSSYFYEKILLTGRSLI